MTKASDDKDLQVGLAQAEGDGLLTTEQAELIRKALRRYPVANPFTPASSDFHTWAWVSMLLNDPLPVIQKWCDTSPDILWWLTPENESAWTATEAQLRKAVFQWLAEGPPPYSPGGNLEPDRAVHEWLSAAPHVDVPLGVVTIELAEPHTPAAGDDEHPGPGDKPGPRG